MSDTKSASIPFEPGAPAAQGTIPLCVPEIHGNEWKYIKECLDTNWVSSVGRFVDRFEQVVAEYVGVRYAVATVSGTAALHLALLAAGVEADDEVLMPTLTFIAPANAVRYTGAWPVFMDVDPVYGQMDPEKTADFLMNECQSSGGVVRNKTTGRRIRAIIPVHILGHPVDLDSFLDLARQYNLVVIEDAAESLGARYRQQRQAPGGTWRRVGSVGDIACLSFNGNKIITTGGGGMVLTDNESWARKVRYLGTQAKDNPIEYIHNEIGYNYRLTNMQAAMGVGQMELLAEHIAVKREIAVRYREGLAGLPGVSLLPEAGWAESVFWLSTILIDAGAFGLDSRAVLQQLRAAGIESRPLWRALHTLDPFKGCVGYHIEAAVRLCRDALSLPSSVGLKKVEQDQVIGMIRKLGTA